MKLPAVEPGEERPAPSRRFQETLAIVERLATVHAPAPARQAACRLPSWPERDRAIPNHLARSALFAPIRLGRRKMCDKVKVASRGDVTIYFSGKQLDMADCDVFMQALNLAGRCNLGDRVYFSRSEFLRSIGKTDGGGMYLWLHESIERLLLATIIVEARRYQIRGTAHSSGMHLIAGFEHDPNRGMYWLNIDARIHHLFRHQEFARIDWPRRLLINTRVDLAKWLQNYLSTHERGVHHTISIKTLRLWCGYLSPVRKFRIALAEALGELKRLGLVSDYELRDDGMVRWHRP